MEHHEDFGRKKVGSDQLILMVGFNGILNIGKEEDLKNDQRQINRWKRIVSRFKSILI